jgi:hypothetical protein
MSERVAAWVEKGGQRFPCRGTAGGLRCGACQEGVLGRTIDAQGRKTGVPGEVCRCGAVVVAE